MGYHIATKQGALAARQRAATSRRRADKRRKAGTVKSRKSHLTTKKHGCGCKCKKCSRLRRGHKLVKAALAKLDRV